MCVCACVYTFPLRTQFVLYPTGPPKKTAVAPKTINITGSVQQQSFNSFPSRSMKPPAPVAPPSSRFANPGMRMLPNELSNSSSAASSAGDAADTAAAGGRFDAMVIW